MRTLMVVLLIAAATACAPSRPANTGLEIVATAYPLAWAVQQIAPDADVTSLASQGQDPHDLELSPQERALLEQAAAIVYLGQIGFQPQVEEAISTTPATVVDASEIVGEERLLHVGDHGHADDAADADEGDAIDPHLWFDPALMADVVLGIGAALAETDPDDAQGYRDRARATADELTALDEEIAGLLGNCEHDEVIVGHEAFGYLLAPHDLVQHGISGAGGHSEASPADITSLTEEIRAEGIPAVLSEPVEGRTDAEAVAREAGVEVIDIYSLDIVEPEQAAKGFPALLREQAQAVARAADCAGAP